jgi:hypothetical protein
MEFKVHAARRQHQNYAGFPHPFAVGLAGGFWAFVNGPHALNFAYMDDGSISWFDLATRRRFPFSEIRPGMVWILM